MTKKYSKSFIRKIAKDRYKIKMCYAIANGTKRPSYDNMCYFFDKYGVPFEIWRDIKSHIVEKEEETEEKKAS